MLTVRLLGQFDVQRSGAPVEMPSRPAQSLLAYLILNAGTAQRRERLAGLLWPDASESNARSNLRHALWRLRKAIGAAYILADRVSVTFDVHADYWLDTAILDTQPSAGGSADDLIEAVSVYAGELLPGFYEEWVTWERERLNAVYEDRVQVLLERLVAEERWRETCEWAERWIAGGQVPEPAYRALMLAHAGLGDQAGMAAVYQRCVEALEEELGVEPSAETRDVYQRCLRGETPKHEEDRVAQLSARAALSPQLPAFLDEESEGVRGPREVFIGRERELYKLVSLLEKALGGRGGVAFVIGEAGQGKTSLLNEFARRALEAQPDLIVARGTCNVYTGVGDPYLPFRDILSMLSADVENQWAAGAISRDHALRLWRLLPHSVQALVEHGPDLIDTFLSGAALASRAAACASHGADWLDRLGELMARKGPLTVGHGPDQSRIFQEYTDVLTTLAAKGPLLLILDDLHWADLSSISLLSHLGRRTPESPILILGAYRPEDVAQGRPSTGFAQPPAQRAGASDPERSVWTGQVERHPLTDVLSEFKRHFGEVWVDLDRSAGAEGRGFVDALLDAEPNRLGEDFREELTRLTGGHPLFTIELLRDMQERDALRKDENGRWIEGPRLDWDVLPARVEAVIEKRFGRLNAELREALTVASVEGETFSAEVVARVRNVDQRELVRRLSYELGKQHRLVSAQGVQRLGSQRLSRYRFRHNLFQKYLYDSLDDVERAYQHEAVGNALESLYGDQGEESAAIAGHLARHFQQAGVPEKAIDYLLQAGNRATRLSANEEAIAHLTLGLELLATLPETPERARKELALQIALGTPLVNTKGFEAPEVAAAYTRARELCERVGETAQLFPVLWGLWLYYSQIVDWATTRELAEQLFQLAERAGDTDLRLLAHNAQGTTLYGLGEFVPALEHYEQALALYDPRQHGSLFLLYTRDPGVNCQIYAAISLWILGYPDQALKRCHAALTRARELAHPFSLANTLIFAAMLHKMRREGQAAQERAEEAQAISSEQGMPLEGPWVTLHRGWALAEQGRVEEGIAHIRQGWVAWRATGSRYGQAYFSGLVAEVCRKVGQTEEALAALGEALAWVKETGLCYWGAELHRLQGELLWMRGGGEVEVEACFQQAIQVAREQSARSLELRATMSLCRLWQEHGKKEQARQMLAEIYGWFTEGFDTADLLEAKALLEELA